MKTFWAVLLVALFMTCHASDQSSPENKGHFVEDHVYINPALGMTLTLPGEWKFLEKDAQARLGVSTDPPADCKGPLCKADIDVALISLRPGKLPRGSVFIGAYKLAAEYMDRRRYPLRKFAESMTTDSLGGSDWVPSGELTAIQLDNKPAYRLLVHKPVLGGEAKGFGYVAETNRYVFVLIASVPDIIPKFPEELQTALENMKLVTAELKKADH